MHRRSFMGGLAALFGATSAVAAGRKLRSAPPTPSTEQHLLKAPYPLGSYAFRMEGHVFAPGITRIAHTLRLRPDLVQVTPLDARGTGGLYAPMRLQTDREVVVENRYPFPIRADLFAHYLHSMIR